MKLNTIHHVAIIVSDYERAKEFYVGKLGFQVLRENYQARRGSYKLDLKAGDQELEVFYMPGAPKRVTNPEACGLRHLCFRVESVEEPSGSWRRWESKPRLSAWTITPGKSCVSFLTPTVFRWSCTNSLPPLFGHCISISPEIPGDSLPSGSASARAGLEPEISALSSYESRGAFCLLKQRTPTTSRIGNSSAAAKPAFKPNCSSVIPKLWHSSAATGRDWLKPDT